MLVAMKSNEVLVMDFAWMAKQVERMCKPAAVETDLKNRFHNLKKKKLGDWN